ncbi:hypothetical protein [Carboxylicivirga sp. N1Y90]|uniref:hypothetical protein n=1 Tax=Carboxylicivirga fragile TaxID=3417571 RepID=UPI003D3599F9|nr:hypothetical protein [Marinilabiliaceae bacterium N1Y90]
MKRSLNTLLVILITLSVFGQEKEKAFKVELHGFVGVSGFYDSRQSVAPRNSHIYLYPKPVQLDDRGNDINATGQYNIDAAHSRFGLHVSGPDVLGAKSFALVEGDFLGKSGSNDVNFRLRHAMIRLSWEKSYLIVGQYWHPLFIPESFPLMIGLDPAIPFNPFARNAQLKYGVKASDNLELNAALVAQTDFKNAGMPTGDEMSQLPELDVQLKYKSKQFLLALTAGVKSLKPMLSEQFDDANDPDIKYTYATDEKVTSYHLSAITKINISDLTVKAGYTYGGNMSNMVMLGGVGRKANTGINNILSEYAATYSGSFWADLQYNIGKVQTGVFFGHSKAYGAREDVSILWQYSIGGSSTNPGSSTIGSLYSVSPRVDFVLAKKTTLGLQYAYTVAGYGDDFDSQGTPINTTDVENHRITVSMLYKF